MPNKIILVDKNDREVGTEFKMKAHREGKLHRAFSIFVFDSQKRLLLQKRASQKYHSGGLWSNTCCSHPRAGETLNEAARRRLKEEMGFVCDLRKIFSFIYKAKLDEGLTEYEFDYVLIGNFDGEPKINPKEAQDFKWVSLEFLSRDIKKNPDKYTYWLKECYGEVVKTLKNFTDK
jgi:isopentenyl-diphosphate Delta-isomerase